MGIRTDGQLKNLFARITIRPEVEKAVRNIAMAEARSLAATIGVLLHEAVTARSSA